MVGKKKLMQEIIEEQLACHPPSSPFGEGMNVSRKLKEKMDKLDSKERRSVKKEIERIKFLRVQKLFESFYR